MSKIGKKNIVLPKDSSIKIEGSNLTLFQDQKVQKNYQLMIKYFLLN